MSTPGTSLRTAALLTGGLVRTSGRLLTDHTRAGAAVALDPDTGAELKADAMPAFVLSTEREATDGHIVMQEWNFSRADTVGIPILWAHQARGDVLGQWRDLCVVEADDAARMTGDKSAGRLSIGRADFDMEHAIAAEKAGQARRGYVRAVSIGWRRGAAVRRSELPKDDKRYREPSEDDCGMPAEGLVMGTREEPNALMECSLVPVPADDGAYAVERAFSRADEAIRTGAPIAGRSLDEILAAVGQHAGARAWLARMVAREVEARLAAVNVNPTPAPKRGIVHFIKG